MRLPPLHVALALVFLAACTDATAPNAPATRAGLRPALSGPAQVWVFDFDNLFDECDGDPYGCASGSVPELNFSWGGESVFPVEWAHSGCCTLGYSDRMHLGLDNRASGDAAAVLVSVWVRPTLGDSVRVSFSKATNDSDWQTTDSIAFAAAPDAWTRIEFKFVVSPGFRGLAFLHAKALWTQVDFDDLTVQRAVADETPPVVGYTQSLTELWPVNHALLPAITGIAATDEVDGVVPVAVSVESPGGAADHQIVRRADGTQDVLLRAERLGHEGDRVYRVVLSAADAAGNAVSHTLRVVVPHDQRRQ